MAALRARDYGDGWTSSGGARWAFFAIFIVFIIVVVFGTLRANKKRTSAGVQPIYGTRWMTPPSYLQSQNQQGHRNRDPETSAYVPTYTAEATDNIDMGYYDAQGEFHPAKKSSIGGPTFTGLGSTGQDVNGEVQQPEAAHRRGTSATDGIPITSVPPPTSGNNVGGVAFTDGISPPAGPPPGISDSETNYDNHHDSQNHPLYNDEDFLRPVGIPPRSTAKTSE